MVYTALLRGFVSPISLAGKCNRMNDRYILPAFFLFSFGLLRRFPTGTLI